MNEQKYKTFFEEVGELAGWDFSSIKCTVEGKAWDFYEEACKYIKKTDTLLDVGTGGGEKLLAIANSALFLVGIDLSTKRISDARHNLISSGINNARFFAMDSEKLQFPNDFFNVVTCRQAPFSAQEVARVLSDDGLFITQQVSEHDKLNMIETFGRGSSVNEDGTLKNKYVNELREAGFEDVEAFDYDATEYYHTYEDLIFLLKHTPIVPNFGQSDHDFVLLDQFIEQYQTSKGIMTNSKRFMIVARK